MRTVLFGTNSESVQSSSIEMQGIEKNATVYDHREWAAHKSSWRHFRHIFSIISSGLVTALAPPVILCTLMALFVSIFNHFVSHDHLPGWVPELVVATIPFTLTSSVLSLLLVFRTNSSYTRYDEARKAWGSNVNRTRDLARQALTWIRSPGDSHKLQCLLRHIKAFPLCLRSHLISESNLRNDLVGVLTPDELESVVASQHRPNYALQVISVLISQCQLQNWEKITMDKNLTQFHDNVGACERLFKTPIPVAYTRLTSRFLTLWHLALPFALWSTCGWLTIPVTAMTAGALFYIEEVGVLIEEPFWILPLTSISGGILSAVDGLSVAHKEASMLMWSIHQQQQPPPSNSSSCLSNNDHVVINFDRSKSYGVPYQPSDVCQVVFNRVNSVC